MSGFLDRLDPTDTLADKSMDPNSPDQSYRFLSAGHVVSNVSSIHWIRRGQFAETLAAMPCPVWEVVETLTVSWPIYATMIY